MAPPFSVTVDFGKISSISIFEEPAGMSISSLLADASAIESLPSPLLLKTRGTSVWMGLEKLSTISEFFSVGMLIALSALVELMADASTLILKDLPASAAAEISFLTRLIILEMSEGELPFTMAPSSVN